MAVSVIHCFDTELNFENKETVGHKRCIAAAGFRTDPISIEWTVKSHRTENGNPIRLHEKLIALAISDCFVENLR